MTSTSEACLLSDVSDKGIGIPSANQPHVFEPFHRGGNAMGDKGHGIGLALSKAITEQLGGNLSVQSEKGMGTIFVFHFPKARH